METKPAMVRERHKSIAAKLLDKIAPPPYKLFVSAICNNDAVTPDEFKKSRWAMYYETDTLNIVRNRQKNPNHLFELFGKFNGKNAVEVRMLLLQHIESNMEFYERRGVVCLKSKAMRFDTWIESIGNEATYCDELALIGLCALYNRHCLVFTKNKFWSTLETINPIGFMQLLQQCSIKLLYLGDLNFGVLNWRPRPPKPQKAVAVPRFSIVEEYTLDDNPADTSQNVDMPSPVETCTPPVPAVVSESPTIVTLPDSNNSINTGTLIPVETSVSKVVKPIAYMSRCC